MILLSSASAKIFPFALLFFFCAMCWFFMSHGSKKWSKPKIRWKTYFCWSSIILVSPTQFEHFHFLTLSFAAYLRLSLFSSHNSFSMLIPVQIKGISNFNWEKIGTKCVSRMCNAKHGQLCSAKENIFNKLNEINNEAYWLIPEYWRILCGFCIHWFRYSLYIPGPT